MKTTLSTASLRTILNDLRPAHQQFAAAYPGESTDRQPVHTVYGGAHLFSATTAARLGSLAERSLDHFAADPATFAQAIALEGDERFAQTLYQRVRAKLAEEAVEDFRIDFEDGYGNRPDSEEDAVAVAAAQEVARGMEGATLPPFIGIRIKPLNAELENRSVRTLDLFLTALGAATGGALPSGFVVTLPKVVAGEQVRALARLLEELEANGPFAAGSLKLELMVETPQSLFDHEGRAHLPRLVAAAEGRCVAAHFGVYDYTASLAITASHQTMDHFACDVARNLMQIQLAGTPIALSDGATNVMPVVAHRAPKEGPPLSESQVRENFESVHRGWRLHFDHVRHSLANSFYQGWDLHPAQLPTRYAALFSFFLESLPAASARLSAFVEKAAQANLVGDVFDDAATGQGLLNFFLRGLNCGAITVEEARATGLTLDELRSRSFLKILAGRSLSVEE